MSGGCIQLATCILYKSDQVIVKPKLQFAKPQLSFNQFVVFYYQTLHQ
jgi:hypothetical protein